MFRPIGHQRAINYYKITDFKIPQPEFTEVTQIRYFKIYVFVTTEGLMMTDMSKHDVILNVII